MAIFKSLKCLFISKTFYPRIKLYDFDELYRFLLIVCLVKLEGTNRRGRAIFISTFSLFHFFTTVDYQPPSALYLSYCKFYRRSRHIHTQVSRYCIIQHDDNIGFAVSRCPWCRIYILLQIFAWCRNTFLQLTYSIISFQCKTLNQQRTLLSSIYRQTT